MVTVNQVTLNNKSRKGAYFRIYNPQTRKTNYYKRGKTHALYRKADALDHWRKRYKIIDYDFLPPGDRRKRTKKMTLHFRMDYDSTPGHEMRMRDSFITAEVDAGMSDDAIAQKLEELFMEAFVQEFGNGLSPYIDTDMIKGLEDGGDEEVIRFQYAHGKGSYLTKRERRIRQVISEREDRNKFMEQVKK